MDLVAREACLGVPTASPPEDFQRLCFGDYYRRPQWSFDKLFGVWPIRKISREELIRSCSEPLRYR